MTIKLTEDEPKPVQRRLAFETPEVTLSVTPIDDGRTYQYCMLTFGLASDQSLDDCAKTWPREALAMARQILADFEEDK